MDNLSAHKGPAGREAVEAARCSLLSLPPCSPDFAPLELAFAKRTAALRAPGARTPEALHAALAAALRRSRRPTPAATSGTVATRSLYAIEHRSSGARGWAWGWRGEGEGAG
jgi:hypothetical protein